MDWVPIEPLRPVTAKAGGSPVVVSLTPAQKRGQRLVITVRTAELSDLSWWKVGTGVRALAGVGKMAGLVRIEPADGPFRLTVMGGRAGKTASVALSVPAPDGEKPDRLPKTPCEFDFDDGWLEVTLPWRKVIPTARTPETTEKPQNGFRTAATRDRPPARMIGGR